MAKIAYYLERAVADGASDIFIVAGGPVSEKLDGHLQHIDNEKLLPPATNELITEIFEIAKRPMDTYLQVRDDDFSFAIPGLARFRVNAYRQRGSLAAVVRVVSFSIPKWDEINIPSNIMDLAESDHGLVLMTGTAGSGKTTGSFSFTASI